MGRALHALNALKCVWKTTAHQCNWQMPLELKIVNAKSKMLGAMLMASDGACYLQLCLMQEYLAILPMPVRDHLD